MLIDASYPGTTRAKSSNIKKINIQNQTFKYIDSDDRVFHPHPISLMMANNIDVDENDIVLDLCTGSGIYAIIAKKLGAKKVIASDISPFALESAIKNAKLNDITNGGIEFIISDYFSEIKNIKFNKIFTNPPCMPVTKESLILNTSFKLAVDGGNDGSLYYKKVIEESVSYLEANGELMISVPKWSNWKSIISLIDEYYTYSIVMEEPVKFFLVDYDKKLAEHINRLNEEKIVDIYLKDGEIYSDILILRCKKRI